MSVTVALAIVAVAGFIAGCCLTFAVCARTARAAFLAFAIRTQQVAALRAKLLAADDAEARHGHVFKSEADALAFAESKDRSDA